MRLLYLSSEYPGISHTFILKEILALRRKGFEVLTASILRPALLGKMPAEEQQEAANTAYLGDSLVRHGGAAILRLLLSSPIALLRMIWGALKYCVFGGPKSLSNAVGYLLEAARLIRHMQDHDIRHVHVHFANPACTVAMLAAMSGKIEYSFSAHGTDVFNNVNENLLRTKAERAIFVRCISHYCKSRFMRILPHSLWEKLHIVRCGVETDSFVPQSRRHDDELVRFLCVGRLCSAKAQHVLLDAFAQLAARKKWVRLTFVGGGEDLEGLRERVRVLGLRDVVTFTGAVGRDDARKAYDDADIFVLPSFAEGVPVVLMEAMAMEIPCISTTIAGIPELITHGKNGILVSPGDVDGLVRAMRAFAHDPAVRRQYGEMARSAVAREYELSRNVAGLADLFTEFAEG